MNPSHSRPILRRLRIPLILAAIVLLALIVLPLSPLSPFRICTLMGCNDSLELILSHPPTQEFTVRATTRAGETKSVTCTPGKNEIRTSPVDQTRAVCWGTSVRFLDFSPQEVTVEIAWQAGSASITGRPEYESFQPNGRFCPPTCRRGEMRVEIP